MPELLEYLLSYCSFRLQGIFIAHKITPAITLTGIILGGILDFKWNLQKAVDIYLIGIEDDLKILIRRELTYEHE